MKPLRVLLAAALLATAAGPLWGQIDFDNVGWDVPYIIDESQSVFDAPQDVAPRDNRGLAIDPTRRFLYLGYNNGSGGQPPQIRKVDLTVGNVVTGTVARVTNVRGKSIAVDDVGRVYATDEDAIRVFDADLTTELLSIPTTNSEGVDVRRENGTLALYATDRTDDTLRRWELTETNGGLAGATPAGLDGDGVITIAGAQSLRGLAVDALGRIWMADLAGDTVWRVDSDGTGLEAVTVESPIDIDFDVQPVNFGEGELRALVSQYTQRTITVLQPDLTPSGIVLTPPFEDLELDPTGQPGHGGGALSGLAVLPDLGLYVANEAGQTPNERSTYGLIDERSGTADGTFFTDLLADDNEPVLFSIDLAAGGDATLDGLVNLDDAGRLTANFGTTDGATWQMADFDLDDDVDIADAGLLIGNWQQPVSNNALQAPAVPEPASLSLLLGGLGLLAGRRRRG